MPREMITRRVLNRTGILVFIFLICLSFGFLFCPFASFASDEAPAIAPLQIPARVPFKEDFESGILGDSWTITGTNVYRTRIMSDFVPHGGSYHLVMDSADTSYSRNEATLTLDLENRENVILTFWTKDYDNEHYHGPPPRPFTNGANFDGVAISADGVLWYEVLPFNDLHWFYQEYTIGLDQAIQENGISYSSNFKIRFNQYDRSFADFRGIAIDDIEIRGDPKDNLQISPIARWETGGPKGGPFDPSCTAYVLLNDGTTSLHWTATSSANWLDVDPKSDTLLPGGMTTVDVCLNSTATGLSGAVYDATVVFTNLDTGIQRNRFVQLTIESFATLPVVEDFESGPDLAPYWKVGGIGAYRTLVTSDDGPFAGNYHLTMDSIRGRGGRDQKGRNELTLSVDLKDQNQVVLSFWAREYYERPHGPPPQPFIGGADFDGVAVSEDGETWYEIQGLRELNSTYQRLCIDLDKAIAPFGLSYDSIFKIRFNRFGTTAIPSEGIAIDSVALYQDNSSPTLRIEQPYQGELITTFPVEVQGQASDESTFTIWIDGQSHVMEGSGAFSLPLQDLPEGDLTLTFYGEDLVGNRSGQILISFTYDTPPSIEILSPEDQAVLNKIAIEGRVSDVRDRFDQCWVNGIPLPVSGEDFWGEIPAVEGENILEATVIDRVGNVARDEITVFVEPHAPELEILRPLDGQILAMNKTQVIGTASDEEGRVWVIGEGLQMLARGGYFSLGVALEEGENLLEFVAEDEAGNRSATTTLRVTYDPSLARAKPALFTLDGFGRVEVAEAGAASATELQASFLPSDQARALKTTSTGLGFWILRGDGWIDVQGDAERYNTFTVLPQEIDPRIDPYFGWDIARDLEPYRAGLVPDTGYYILDGFGGVHLAGEALASGIQFLSGRPFFGWDIARDLEITDSGRGYYLLDGFGGLHAVGDAVLLPDPPPYWAWDIARSFELRAVRGETEFLGGDYFYKAAEDYALYVLDGFGGVHTEGVAVFYSTAYFGWDIAEDIELVGNESPYDYLQLDGFGGRHWSDEGLRALFPALFEPGFDIMRDLDVYAAEQLSVTD